MKWEFSASQADHSGVDFGSDLNFAFNNVQINLGSYFTNMLGPMVEYVQKYTEPYKDFFNLLGSDIPIIADLAKLVGMEGFTWLELAGVVADSGKGPARICRADHHRQGHRSVHQRHQRDSAGPDAAKCLARNRRFRHRGQSGRSGGQRHSFRYLRRRSRLQRRERQRLVGPQNTNWNSAGQNAGSLADHVFFNQFQNLTGGTGNDRFVIQNAQAVIGAVAWRSTFGLPRRCPAIYFAFKLIGFLRNNHTKP